MPDVVIRVERGLGRITLNRPGVINALNRGMVVEIHAALTRWAGDDSVRAVLLDGAGERGLCAGGDIRSVHDDARAGGSESIGFWTDEYRMNAAIGAFPKPYVALMDGVVMGGGVGVSAHGSVRVVTERTRLAMPEVGIGLAPDVGGAHLLSRAPGELGTYAALTAAHLSAADALHCGLADHFVPSAALPALVDDLEFGAHLGVGVEAVVARHTADPGPSALAGRAPWVDHCFAADTVEEVLARLEAAGHADTAALITTKSPTALKVALEALRRARELPDLDAVLAQDLRVSSACLRDHDLVEGIRAQIVDKDRAPRWSPATLAGVSREAVLAHF
ncbi:enoyl-CoA hydratase/isomerase family protein [Actinosynnema pretiosum]|uniref:3-hydroxyisobutyryl-CoA hydrolase n=1 Tax=Actinosynnema pretiosum TaxID=42197 RepID=A0A290Z6N1_9PSEU|nr:enoyl-CoA hydratase/isomerase family protein [Actinosynnema pretiosum]ATE54623.1 3-hydroxyisobutyryl-CoA hydrolase [Actinosynnema pretiosum]